ncbi:MAG: DUF3307 domain-containing protein [Actinomycetota bacterium]|jgi:hypothetical protein|nr:DUF3307 domain-containing protein [Actinomycetota bacterium]
MSLLLNLYLGHLLGDFLLQPGKLVAAKRRGIAGLLIHGSIIGICTAIILYKDIYSLWSLILLVISAHLLIEVVTITARTRTRMSGLGVFLIDQAMHMSSLALLTALAQPRIDIADMTTLGFSLELAQLAFICGLFAVSFMGSILVFETVRALGPTEESEILPFDAARLAGMAERGFSLALAVSVAPQLLLLPFFPRVILAFTRKDEKRAKLLIETATGLALCMSVYGLIVWAAGATMI